MVRGYCFNFLGEKVMYDLRRDVFNSFILKDTAFFDTNKSGELMSRITSDIAVL